MITVRTARREQIRLITSEGAIFVDGVVIGVLAVHAAYAATLDDGAPYWTVTHIPTGFRMGRSIGFEREADTVGFIRSLAMLPVDWDDPQTPRRDKRIAAVFVPLAALFDAVELLPQPEGVH